METSETHKLDTKALESQVKAMYKDVALNPHGQYHFEMGRGLADKLGYEKAILDRIPEAATESFAGVGYYFDMANLSQGQKVLDLGSGSGMDTFFAAIAVGKTGSVSGVDMTDEQLHKATQLSKQYGFDNVSFHKAYIENLPFTNDSFDVAISNGVINLCPDKEAVFAEIARILKPGGRMAIADIVTEKQLPENVVCNSTLWASCIGGASQRDSYKSAIEHAGMKVLRVRNNKAYNFISKSAQGATRDYGVKSISVYAQKQ